jgi:hypothetical protein
MGSFVGFSPAVRTLLLASNFSFSNACPASDKTCMHKPNMYILDYDNLSHQILKGLISARQQNCGRAFGVMADPFIPDL